MILGLLISTRRTTIRRNSFDKSWTIFWTGYWRNRQQSQPNHIEIIIEKLTVRTILSQVSSEYTIPVSTIRGMGPTVPKKKLADRLRRSQKRKLTLLVVSDLDPAGDAIAAD